MTTATQTLSHQSHRPAALIGTWKLGAGRAITLQPREDAVLRVAHGCIWVTLDGPHSGPLNGMGDRFIGAGEQITVAAGQRLVTEPMGGAEAGSVYFSWEPLASPFHQLAHQALRQPVRSPSRLQLAVLQPLADLRGALVLALAAVGRLGTGVFGLAADLVAGRDRKALAACAFNAQAKACRAHGAMS